MRVVRGTPKHLSRTGKLNKFTYLMLNLPFKCNYRCLKCFDHGKNKPDAPSINACSPEDRRRLIADAKKMGGQVVVIPGEGEPSLNTGIRSLVSEVNKHQMIPIIYSNGSSLTPELVEFYAENNATIVVSFDSLDAETYGELTGTRGQIEKAIQNVRRLIDVFKNTIETGNDLRILRVAINTTLTSLNENEVSRIREFGGENAYFICNPLVRLGRANQNWHKLIRGSDTHEIQKQLIERFSESGGPLTLGTDGLCGYSAWGIAVDPGGEYMTCAYTTETNGLLGHIRTKDLRSAFEYKHYLELRQYDSYGKAPCLVRSNAFREYLTKLKETK